MTCSTQPRRPSMLAISLWGIDMQRDDELVRRLLLELEADPEPVVLRPVTSEATDEERREYYHLRLLTDAGFLEETGRYGGAFRITNSGHDFLAMMKDEGFWSQMRARARTAVPAYGLRLLFEIGDAMMREKLHELGLL